MIDKKFCELDHPFPNKELQLIMKLNKEQKIDNLKKLTNSKYFESWMRIIQKHLRVT